MCHIYRACIQTRSWPIKPLQKRHSLQALRRRKKDAARKAKKAKGVPRPAFLGVPIGTLAKTSQTKAKVKAKAKAKKTPPKDPIKFMPHALSLQPIVEGTQPTVPPLSYGLERVLFNPGVYHLQDPRTRVFNFDPYLSEIMPLNEFDFNALKAYVTSSKDKTLISIAKRHEKRYAGSTSSMTAMLAHFHFLLSGWRDIDLSLLSKGFPPESLHFTRIQRAPAAAFLHWKDGTYAIDADKEYDTANVLSMLGKSMEKLLTLPKDKYERYRVENSDQISEEERNAEEAYHYTSFQDFMMRSQLDAHDPRLPGTGMFDLKTRAVVSIRMDARDYEKGLGYEIRSRFGQYESFEREYFDMIRSAFLKYSLQVRMGRMDGIFVAFHNVERIFGFHYIPLSEMDMALHGTSDTRFGDMEFKASLKLMNELYDRATKKFPNQSLRIHLETRDSTVTPFMYFFAQPTTPEEIEAVQDANKANVEAFERKILGLVEKTVESKAETAIATEGTNETDADGEEQSTDRDMMDVTWQEAREMVKEAIDDDEVGLGVVREAVSDALEQSGILRGSSTTETREYVDALIQALTGREPPLTDVAAPDGKDGEIPADNGNGEASEQIEQQKESSSPPLPDLESQIASATEETVEKEAVPQENTSTISPTEQPGSENASSAATAQGSGTDSPDVEVAPPTAKDTPEDNVASEDEQGSIREAEETSPESVPADDAALSSLEPLKRLIMRTAKRFDQGPAPGVDTDDAQEDDASKLKEFERILGDLISAQSRREQLGSDVDGSATDLDTSTSKESLDDAVASETDSDMATPDSRAQSQTSGSDAQTTSQADTMKETPQIFGATLTIKNRLGNDYVAHPTFVLGQKWTVEYEIEEMEDDRALTICNKLKARRRQILQGEKKSSNQWLHLFRGRLDRATRRGREFRQRELMMTKGKPVYMVRAEGGVEMVEFSPSEPKTSLVKAKRNGNRNEDENQTENQADNQTDRVVEQADKH
ncbi:mitochondrial membrane protein Pet127 [Poronia punctata]|nr:mitochondrial membrane protein Pet127 [Poronia punctata]